MIGDVTAMKSHSKLMAVLLALLLALLLGSCATPRERRIQSNPAIFHALAPDEKTMVQGGSIREGMSREAVFLAYGRPDRVAKGRKQGRDTEHWEYWTVQPMVVGYGMGMAWRGPWIGPGCGYCGPWDPYWGTGPYLAYPPQRSIEVNFTDGRVTDFMVGPQ